jgi:hypothetical protein
MRTRQSTVWLASLMAVTIAVTHWCTADPWLYSGYGPDAQRYCKAPPELLAVEAEIVGIIAWIIFVGAATMPDMLWLALTKYRPLRE